MGSLGNREFPRDFRDVDFTFCFFGDKYSSLACSRPSGREERAPESNSFGNYRRNFLESIKGLICGRWEGEGEEKRRAESCTGTRGAHFTSLNSTGGETPWCIEHSLCLSQGHFLSGNS
jgi:hypothetical protein